MRGNPCRLTFYWHIYNLARLLAAALLLSGLCAAHPAYATAAEARIASPGTPTPYSVGAAGGTAAWGDYDNDGDLDLLFTGIGNGEQRSTVLMKYQAGELEIVDSGLPDLEESSAAWGDYDNDGYLDVAITGMLGFTGGQILGWAGIYHNTADPEESGERIFQLAQALPNIYMGTAAWGDYNNDGHLDVLLSGYTDNAAPLSKIYRGDGATFTEVFAGQITALSESAAAWGDYDNDNFLDFVIAGRAAGGTLRTILYHNNGGASFSAATASLSGVYAATTTWINYDNDADLDLLVTGNQGDNGSNILPSTRLYRNNGGSFSLASSTGLPNLWNSSVSAGDYDNDGYTDLLLNGMTTTYYPTRLYINNHSGTFTDADLSLWSGSGISVALGDYNQDNTLDFALTGITNGSSYQTFIYPNDSYPFAPANSAPAAPTLKSACWDGANRLTLRWDPAAAPLSDDHTPQAALTYGLSIGSAPGLGDVVPAQANLSSGYRRAVQPGSQSTGLSTVVLSLPYPQAYYWSVQAVDGALTGGSFAPARRIDLGTTVAAADATTTDEDQSVLIDILANDTHFASPSIYSYTQGAHGTVTAQGGGLRYQPNANWHGTDTFTYQAINTNLYCSAAVVTVTVASINDTPSNISLAPGSVLEGSPVGTLVGTLTTTDADAGDTFTYSLPAGVLDNDQFSINANQLRTQSVFSYAARSSYSVRVHVQDAAGAGLDKDLAVTIIRRTPVTIACVDNCAGFSGAAVQVTMSEDGMDDLDQPDAMILTLRADDEGAAETLSWTIITPPAVGTAGFGADHTPTAVTAPAGALEIHYTPPADWSGNASFILGVSDPQGNTDQVTVNAQVKEVNDAPRLLTPADTSYIAWSGAHSIQINGISPGPALEAGQTLTLSAESSNTHAVQNLQVTYPGSGSTATLSFEIADGGGGNATITLTLEDGQAYHHSTVVEFKIRVTNGMRFFVPMVEG